MPGGSILEAMAKAVEDASVVVMALSEKYKKSPNCRTGNLYSINQLMRASIRMSHYSYKKKKRNRRYKTF